MVSAANVSLSASTTHGSVDLHRGHRGTPCAIGPTRFRALQVGQSMMVIITRLEPGRAAVVSPPDQPDEGGSGRIPAATRRACVKRSIETIRTSCSTRSTPHARTRHMTPRAPLRAHRRRRRDSQAACSRTRARWRWSYVLVFVSIARANARPGRSRPSRCPLCPATAISAVAAAFRPVLRASADSTAAQVKASGGRKGTARGLLAVTAPAIRSGVRQSCAPRSAAVRCNCPRPDRRVRRGGSGRARLEVSLRRDASDSLH